MKEARSGAGPAPGGERTPSAAVAEVFRRERRPILATLIRVCGGDFELAEDALQEALASALERWPESGIPPKPAAWITTTARRKAIDRLRRDRSFREKRGTIERLARLEQEDARMAASTGAEEGPLRDDQLRLVFTCCHPALSLEARVALTLRTVAGLATPEIARAFLTSEATMAQRLVRAKRKIREAGIPYRIPAAPDLEERLSAVRAVVYLVFNEGYASTGGSTLLRTELCREAIRLGTLVVELVPGDPESQGLLALMLLHDGRREGRTATDGSLITLEEQDRSRWNRNQIAIGRAVLDRALRHGAPGPYQVQAAIAAEHARAARAQDTDWDRIAALYDQLLVFQPTPVVELNRAAAVAMARGPDEGLRLLDDIAIRGVLDRYHLLHAARADLLRRSRRHLDAADAYRKAIALCSNPVERDYLERRLAEVAAGAP